MPKVGGRSYGYTRSEKKKAKAHAKRTGQTVRNTKTRKK